MQTAIGLFLRMHCKTLCVQTDDDAADITIVDLDDCPDPQTLAAYRRKHPARPIIALSLRPAAIEGVHVVHKPLHPETLKGILAKLRQSVRMKVQVHKLAGGAALSPAAEVEEVTEYRASGTYTAAVALDGGSAAQVGTRPDIDPEDAAALASIQYRPEDFFQHVLKQAFLLAKSEDHYVGIETPHGEVVVYPGGLRVQTYFTSQNACRALCSFPTASMRLPVAVLPADFQPPGSASGAIGSAESLVWEAALFSARGRIPAGTPLNVPIYMSSWPNMTRLTLFPHAMQIAALWAREPYSLRDTAKALGIPQRFVFAFFSAASALGHVGVTRRTVDRLFHPPAVEATEKRGLLSRILSKLRISDD